LGLPVVVLIFYWQHWLFWRRRVNKNGADTGECPRAQAQNLGARDLLPVINWQNVSNGGGPRDRK